MGELLKGLVAGVAERTLVVLMADHGESLGDHGEFTHGVFLYDSTMHIPLMAAGPGLPAGKVITQQVRSIDVMPTIVDYLGLSPGNQAQGTSLLPAMIDGASVARELCLYGNAVSKDGARLGRTARRAHG